MGTASSNEINTLLSIFSFCTLILYFVHMINVYYTSKIKNDPKETDLISEPFETQDKFVSLQNFFILLSNDISNFPLQLLIFWSSLLVTMLREGYDNEDSIIALDVLMIVYTLSKIANTVCLAFDNKYFTSLTFRISIAVTVFAGIVSIQSAFLRTLAFADDAYTLTDDAYSQN